MGKPTKISFSPGPPEQASRYLRSKELQPAFSYLDVEAEEHAVNFTVAKAMQIDVLTSIKDALQVALDEGRPFSEFERDITPVLQGLGWWGKGQPMRDVDGRLQAVTLGTPRRLRVIYDTNMRTARAAGQWDRIQRTKAAMPYLTYRLGPSERHRPAHRAKEGITLPVDDPFWQSWYPPNGWGCKCWVRQVTAEEAESLGITQSPQILTSEWENPRTGELRDIPMGIDPGWEVNPGAMRLHHVEQMLHDKLLAAPRDVQKVALRDIATSDRVRQLATQDLPGNAPIGIIPPEFAAHISAPSPIVEFSDKTRQHVFEEKTDRRLGDLRFMADLDEAPRVALQRRAGQADRLIFEIDSGNPNAADPYDRLPLHFVVASKSSGNFLNTFYRTVDARWDRILARDGVTVLRDVFK